MDLVTTGHPDFRGASEEKAYLGPWCRPPAGALLTPDPWEDREALHRAALGAEEACERLLPPLGRLLDSVHGGARPERYWAVVLGPWLSRHLHFVADRAARVDAALAAHPGAGSVLLDPASARAPADMQDFQDRGFTDAFNLQVFSALLRRRGVEGPARAAAAPRGRLFARRGRFLKAVVGRAARTLAPEALLSELFPSREDELRLAAALPGRIGWFLSSAPEPPETPDAERRAALASLPGQSPLERDAVALLPECLPRVYLEGYAPARRAALDGWRRRPKVLVSSTGWIFDEALKLAGAEFALEGTKLVGAQHGGGYGHDLDTPTERLERRGRDRWVSWGWRDDADSRVCPLPAPHTAAFSGLGDPSARDLCFSVNGFPLYPYLLYSFPIGGQISDGIALQERFIRALPEPAFARLKVRPYPLERGWSQSDRLRRARPGARFEVPGTRFADFLRTARVVVFDNVGTGFLEALAAGVPALAYQEARFLRVRPSAERDFRLLLEARMLFDSPEAAARHAASVLDRPSPWWGSREVLAALERWRPAYAGASGPWLPAWKSFMLGLLS